MCGRTACTVRGGGGRKPGQSGSTRRTAQAPPVDPTATPSTSALRCLLTSSTNSSKPPGTPSSRGCWIASGASRPSRTKRRSTIGTAPPVIESGIYWLFDDPEIAQTLLLRELVSDPNVIGELTRAFDLAGKKTEVKTYLTDRAQTGDYQTNREKRWESHPDGVQFAFRRDCLKIEHKLLSQICHFDGSQTMYAGGSPPRRRSSNWSCQRDAPLRAMRSTLNSCSRVWRLPSGAVRRFRWGISTR